MKHHTLSQPRLRDIRSELERERKRFADHDPRSNAIATALSRVEDGTYGRCHGCGRDIPFGRLIAIPETLYCIDCGAGGSIAS